MGGVTDDLCLAVQAAAGRDPRYREIMASLQARHVEAVELLLPSGPAANLVERIQRDCEDLNDVLRAAWIIRDGSRGTFDLVMGQGEIWAAQMLAGALSERGLASAWLDSRDILVVEPGRARATPEVYWDRTRERLAEWQDANPLEADALVITGFVATTPNGVPSTLGRNGSDYSASIFAALFEADEIHIWSDVDGVMSADPRLVPDAMVLEALSYQEANELAA